MIFKFPRLRPRLSARKSAKWNSLQKRLNAEVPHFMLKEIFEQPQAVQNAIRGRISHEEATARIGGLNLTPGELRTVDRIIYIACGSALHAGMVGEYLMKISHGSRPSAIMRASSATATRRSKSIRSCLPLASRVKRSIRWRRA